MTALGIVESERIAVLPPVLRRHTLAMKVVKHVNDEESRWLLFDHVVTGSHPEVDAALASPFRRLWVASHPDLAQAA